MIGSPYYRRSWFAVGAALAVLGSLCVSAVLPAASASAATGTPRSYAFDDDAARVEGASSNTDAEKLQAGSTYRSSLPRGDVKLYYRLQLDATSNAYVSVTAVPSPTAKVMYADGIKVSLEDGDGRTCSYNEEHFGAAESARPIAAWASRTIGPTESYCQEAAAYYVVVERTGTSPSTQEDWDLELQYVSEPALKQTGSTVPPEVWDSASPQPLDGEPEERKGGAGFSEARGLTQGVWKDDIEAGETLFYRVPVDWGQQLFATAELGSARGGTGYVGNALVTALYNPVRGFVVDTSTGYDGEQKSETLYPLPPVAYKNRYDTDDRVSGMRFAGWYYLVVHLNPEIADEYGEGSFGLTLRVTVRGAAQAEPEYAGSPQPADAFSVTDRDKDAAASGETEAEAERGDTMKLVAACSLGTGVALVLFLVGWTVVARRRAGAGVPREYGTP
ncbi:hypothetical protein [Streptomyces jeddahensis]|uniref:Uncharacterized protein n=1 Tax=Streptomyces jeddahensis TaxID=1716141 RepID=A0A177HMM5_9ACTN|nr:hypothetical protein [Streptomyces jeddahensis]OAH11850.1 hypothetical protein STSP_48570 [Streptomyces jeddahensis]